MSPTMAAREAKRVTRATVAAWFAGFVVAVGMVMAPSSPAAAQVCGNGITEPGEQCDPADNPTERDACDGCAEDCTITAECGLGPCTDFADNDGDGLTDDEDPECGSLPELNTLAVTGLDTRVRSVRLQRESRVAIPAPAANPRAEVCGRQVDVGGLAVVEGNLTAVDESRFAHRLASGIAGVFTTTAGELPDIRLTSPLVGGSTGICSETGGSCLSPIDCFSKNELCIGRPELTASNPDVDLTGGGVGSAMLDRCNNVLANIAAKTEALLAFGEPSEERLRLRRAEERNFPVQSGFNIFNYEEIRLGARSVLTIDGPVDAVVVFRVQNRLRMLTGARVELFGGVQASRVLWLVDNVRPAIVLGNDSSLVGIVLAPDKIVRPRRGVSIRGAIVGKRIDMLRASQVDHVPFLGLLPADVAVSLADSPDPVSPGGTLTYDVDVTNNGIAWAEAINLDVTLDPAVTFVGATPENGVCLHDGSPTGGTLTCFLGNAAPLADAPANQVGVEVEVTVGVGAAGSIPVTAAVTHSMAEPTAADDSISVSTAIVP